MKRETQKTLVNITKQCEVLRKLGYDSSADKILMVLARIHDLENFKDRLDKLKGECE